MFPCKSFIVLALTFRLLIHFELIFVYGVKKDPNSFFACGYSLVIALLIKKNILSTLNNFGTHVKINLP